MLEILNRVVSFINDNILWGIPMIVAILGTGIFLTVRTRALQVRKFGTVMNTTIVPTVRHMVHPDSSKTTKKEKALSQFEAFSTALSGTVGTGNIVGVTGALLAGGPGAIFWMWVSAFVGMATNFVETVLAVFYRKKDKNGEWAGGPMQYIENGLRLKWLAVLFAACCVLAATGMGMVQTNSISGVLQNSLAPDNASAAKAVAWIVGIVVAGLTALIILGGVKRIGKVSSVIAPFMSLLFILMALLILILNITALPAALGKIFAYAFNFRAVSGGFLGTAIMLAMRQGFARGIFSNEAGLGSTCIAHAASDTREPVRQGMWGVFAVFLDTIVICSLTALTLLSVAINHGGVDFVDILANGGVDKNVMASYAFCTTFGTFGTIVFSVILPLFAFSTILAWAFYGEKAASYLCGAHEKAGTVVFKTVFVVLLVIGALVKSDLVWSLDDMFNAMMALPNLIALILLSGTAVKITRNYFDRKKGINVEPLLSAYPEESDAAAQENQA